MDSMTLIRKIAASQDGTVTLTQANAAGLTVHEVHRLCRSGRWRRLARAGYLVDADRYAEIPRRVRIRAAVASFGRSAAAVLDTAAELHGIAGTRRTEAIHVSLPGPAVRPSRDTDPAVIIHQLTIGAAQLCDVAGIPVTRPVRTVADIIVRADRFTAVSVLDSAVNRQVVTAEEFAMIPGLIRGRRGAVAARGYLAECDGRAQSPLETRLRLRCVDGRVAPDVLQHEVRDRDGCLLGVGDLAWLAARLIGEADGREVHGTPEAVYQDRWRQNRIVNAGWRILRFTWDDTMRPDYIPFVVRNALAASPLPR
ncbi:type IV toxin-antitoxin system AbiEi family antitoxin domain-containing protein [Micromonospora sonneratiae]